MSRKVKDGDIVRVHYTARYEDGEIYDSSLEREPLQFEIGAGEVIEGLELALLGMRPGDQKTIIVEPDQGFGERDEELLIEIEKEYLPNTVRPAVGMWVQIVDEEGETTPVMVTEIGDDSIVVDANHPLSGKYLEFDIELIEIVDKEDD